MTNVGMNIGNERRRLRVGLVVLMAGLAVLLAAVSMAILRQPPSTGDQFVGSDAPDRGAPDNLAPARLGLAMPVLAVLAIVLVVTLLLVSYSLFRLTRKLALPKRPGKNEEPTSADDVWRMHRVPEEPPTGQVDGQPNGGA